jgi:hypothetical protein
VILLIWVQRVRRIGLPCRSVNRGLKLSLISSSLVESSEKLLQSDPSLVFTVPSQSGYPTLLLVLRMELPTSPPGYREPKEDDTSLSVVLDSLIPFIRDPNSLFKLPVYLGNFVLDSANCDGEAISSCPRAEGAGKEFTWSRGLGIEYSSVKTRSARKKSAVSSTLEFNSRPSTDSGALRAMKALAG